MTTPRQKVAPEGDGLTRPEVDARQPPQSSAAMLQPADPEPLLGIATAERHAIIVDIAYLFMASRKAYGLGLWGTLVRSAAFLLVRALLQVVLTFVVMSAAILSG